MKVILQHGFNPPYLPINLLVSTRVLVVDQSSFFSLTQRHQEVGQLRHFVPLFQVRGEMSQGELSGRDQLKELGRAQRLVGEKGGLGSKGLIRWFKGFLHHVFKTHR